MAIDAAQACCTVGEITQAMEKIFGRHVATDRMVSGAYKMAFSEQQELQDVIDKVEVGQSLNQYINLYPTCHL